MEREEVTGQARRVKARSPEELKELKEQGGGSEAAAEAGDDAGRVHRGPQKRLVGDSVHSLASGSEADADAIAVGDVDGDAPSCDAAGSDVSPVGNDRDEVLDANCSDPTPVEYPILSLEDTIEEFCDYLVFVYDHTKAIFRQGTVL